MMKLPKFILQSEPVLTIEKYACRFTSNSLHQSVSINKIIELNWCNDYIFVPVGSVEFVKKFCEHFNILLPTESISYYEPVLPYIQREIKKTIFSEAKDIDFVKPVGVKTFTGGIKNTLEKVDPEVEVWASVFVPFESEFRFYIQDYFTGPKILGWSRYDDTDSINPDPPLEWVNEIAQSVHRAIGPNAYTIDVGWRSDIQKYDVVELNDAWALGLYKNTDPQSSPPSYERYSEMLVSRWRQILFCNNLIH